MLGFFKYGGFLVENLNALAERFDLPTRPIEASRFLSNGLNEALACSEPRTRWSISLPAAGASRSTYSIDDFSIDYYRRQVSSSASSAMPRSSPVPRLSPGRSNGPATLPQHGTPRISREDLADGLSLFVVGLFKKVAMADYLAMYVDPVYATPRTTPRPAVLLAAFAFAWQIHFDFMATDLARGIARLWASA